MNAPLTPTSASQQFCVVPVLRLPPDTVQFYFQRMAVHETLQWRFTDIVDPQWEDVIGVIKRMGNHMFAVMKGDQMAGEFALENLVCRAAQGHFSTSPDITTKERIHIGKEALKYIFSIPNKTTGEPFLDAVYGLTPLKNRAACMFALKIGFKKQGVLPSGAVWNKKPCDCMISVASRG